MNPSILTFQEIRHSDLPLVGGKGANLGEMTNAGFPIPEGFCITTQAYLDFLSVSTEMTNYFILLEKLEPNDLLGAEALGKAIRAHLMQLPFPKGLACQIETAWKQSGAEYAYAVRSSATAEDLPNASFAGQQDTYLNIRGLSSLLDHIKQCWASLFTDRAIVYRAKNSFDHRQVLLSVVVQRMVFPQVSGILFTADPISSNRKVVSIDASFGLGEALVSGLVSADQYKVKDDKIIEKNISRKQLAIIPLPQGGTIEKALVGREQTMQALPDHLILQLAQLGKRIERHYGKPQDIEFCVEDGKLFVVQSRPITTLFPAPQPPQNSFRVLASVGHIQVMLDPMKPLALSYFRTMIPEAVLKTAGGRLYVDLTDVLRKPIWRRILLMHAGNLDEQMHSALLAATEHPEFKALKGQRQSLKPLAKILLPVAGKAISCLVKSDPAQMRKDINRRMEQTITDLHNRFRGLEGTALLETARKEASHVVDLLIPVVYGFVTYIIADMLLQKQLNRLTGSAEDIHELAKSQSGNIMREMSLELGDLADIVRRYPQVRKYLKTAEDDTFFECLQSLEGGTEFADAYKNFLFRFGMRCPGELDMTRPRWAEAPTMLISGILSDVENFRDGEHWVQFEKGLEEATQARQRILSKAGHGLQHKFTDRLIGVYRASAAMREHHKHMITLLLDAFKQPVMQVARQLAERGILSTPTDAYWLELDELIVLTNGSFHGDVAALIRERKQEFERMKSITVPRVMTSDGEIIIGNNKKGDYPKDALVGTAVSSGITEGVARVIHSPEHAQLRDGEILVAPHTDPGWTPLFQSAAAVVTEVGGLMTHGSVVAREYGIPAVVGIDHITSLIHDGQRIRVNGTLGYVEVLDER